MTIPSTPRKAGPFTGNGSQTVWPFSFKVFSQTDVKVTIADTEGAETVLSLGQYTVALNANQETSPGGEVTYALTNLHKLTITGKLPYDQPLDLPSGGNFSPQSMENQLDRLAMQVQQVKEEVDRAAKLPVTNGQDPAELVDDIVRLADSADNIDAVASDIANVNTVAADIADVSTVAGIAGNVTTVAGVSADVSTVAGIAGNVTTVAGVAADVSTVAGAVADVGIVADSIADVSTVAGVAADVTAVAGAVANVDTVADNIAAINTVASDLNEPVSEIETVAGAIANVNTVGGNIANVNTVAGVSGNVTTVAGIAANVTTVAGIAANVTTVAGVAADVPAVAAVAADVSTVAGISADVEAVADMAGEVTNFADVYQGAKTSDPSLRNDGSALQAGDLYLNTVDGVLRGYTGTTWVSGAVGTVLVTNFSGNGSQTAFVLPTAPASENSTQVFISGVYQQKSVYSLSGATITFSTAPPTGTNNIEVVTIAAMPAAETDAALVNYATTGETVEDALDVRLPEIATYTLLRAYTGALTAFNVRGVSALFDGGEGVFRVDSSDTTSSDNGGTILVDAGGRRWKRVITGATNVRWFGAVGDGVTDDLLAINAAASFVNLNGGYELVSSAKTVTAVSAADDKLTIASHGYSDYTAVVYIGDIAGLVSGRRYFVKRDPLDLTNKVLLADTHANVASGPYINITSATFTSATLQPIQPTGSLYWPTGKYYTSEGPSLLNRITHEGAASYFSGGVLYDPRQRGRYAPLQDLIGYYATLRSYVGPMDTFVVRGVAALFDGGEGVFRIDRSDTTSADNGGTILVDALNRRWKRVFSGDVDVRWFGAVGDATTDNATAISQALSYAILSRGYVTAGSTNAVTVASAADEKLTVVAHGYSDYDVIIYTGDIPGLTSGRRYFVKRDPVDLTNKILLADSVSKVASGPYVDITSSTFTSATVQLVEPSAALTWPDGTYLVSTNLPAFHKVTHRGMGAVKRGTDLFHVQARTTITNRLYVSTTGDNANDGITSAAPLKFNGVDSVLKKYGPVLNGTWVVNVVAGTYTDRVVFSTLSSSPVQVTGPSGWVTAPTVIIDGTTGSLANCVSVRDGANVKFTNIKATKATDNVVECIERSRIEWVDSHATFATGASSGACFYVANSSRGYVDGRSLLDNAVSSDGVLLAYGSSVISVGQTATGTADAPHIDNGVRGVNAQHQSLVKLRYAYVDTCTYGVYSQSGSHISHENGAVDNCTYAYFATGAGNLLLNESTVTHNGLTALRYHAVTPGVQDRPIQTDDTAFRRVGLFSAAQCTNSTITGATADVLSAATALLDKDFNAKGRAIRVVLYANKTGSNGALTLSLAGSVGGLIRSVVFADTDTGDFTATFTTTCLSTASTTVEQLNEVIVDFDQKYQQYVNAATTDNLSIAQNISISASVAAGDTLTVRAVEVYQAGL